MATDEALNSARQKRDARRFDSYLRQAVDLLRLAQEANTTQPDVNTLIESVRADIEQLREAY